MAGLAKSLHFSMIRSRAEVKSTPDDSMVANDDTADPRVGIRISPRRLGQAQRLAGEAIETLRAVFAPQGFNVGWNLGRVAGAGIVDHGHVHVVPRWGGDTNFMPVLADVRVIPEHLSESRRRLADAWPS